VNVAHDGGNGVAVERLEAPGARCAAQHAWVHASI
jgi:hypothetical protein